MTDNVNVCDIRVRLDNQQLMMFFLPVVMIFDAEQEYINKIFVFEIHQVNIILSRIHFSLTLCSFDQRFH